VENGRPVLRVTNSGVSASIRENGAIAEQTVAFQEDVRNWSIRKSSETSTFYTRHGDWFVQVCATISVIILLAAFVTRRRSLS
jgi:apolipoprotein N-acyltransferase